MEANAADWNTLERLRTEFLNAKGATGVYWKSSSDLAQYHRFFAARIGWKWDDAIEQAKQAGWQLRSARLFDWGCGSGIATLRLLDAVDSEALEEVFLWDHSTLACEFARNAIAARYPNLKVSIANPSSIASLEDTLFLASHVLNELTLNDRDSLAGFVRSASQIFWVEPGSSQSSRLLTEQRDRLLGEFSPVAPCVGSQSCPMHREENARHWCHFFAKPPVEAFTDGDWARFGQIMEIDLRSLPYSFLVLDAKRHEPARSLDGKSRVLGRPRQYKGFSRIFSCDHNGLNDYELQKRDDKTLWKIIKKGKSGTLYEWTETVSGRIRSGKPAEQEES